MSRLRAFVASAAIMCVAGSMSCKVNLTPSSIANAYKGIKDARKDLTPENEYYVGRAVATNLLAKSDYKYLDSEDLRAGQLTGVTAYVNRVGAVVSMAALATRRKGDRPSPIGGWHFVILEDNTINAFAAPGGYIFITTAALMAAKNEDELAAILAHEVAHVVRGHALGTIKKSRWAGVAKSTLDATVELDEASLGKLTGVFENAMDDMVDGLLVKGYSRKTEFEADRVGMDIMVHAGYDPGAFVRYLQTLSATQSTGSGGFSATHPKASDRVKKLKKMVAKVRRRRAPAIRTHRFVAATAPLRGGAATAGDELSMGHRQ